MGRPEHAWAWEVADRFQFPMIPPQVNGATEGEDLASFCQGVEFPMIPPQVNGATTQSRSSLTPPKQSRSLFPMIPPQVNGATQGDDLDPVEPTRDPFPMIPPQVNGATSGYRTRIISTHGCFQ